MAPNGIRNYMNIHKDTSHIFLSAEKETVPGVLKPLYSPEMSVWNCVKTEIHYEGHEVYMK